MPMAWTVLLSQVLSPKRRGAHVRAHQRAQRARSFTANSESVHSYAHSYVLVASRPVCDVQKNLPLLLSTLES